VIVISEEKSKEKVKDVVINDKQLVFSVKQISALTTFSKSLIFNQIASGNLKVVRCGRRTCATKAQIDEWLAKLSIEI